jgi:transposase
LAVEYWKWILKRTLKKRYEKLDESLMKEVLELKLGFNPGEKNMQ